MKRKTIFYALIAIISIIISVLPTAALPDKSPHNWYFRKTDDGTPPSECSDLSFVGRYTCRWIDRNPKDKVIYLTFDAGYENGNVAKILDSMKEYNAKGTFFILENLINRNPELVKRMANEGHTIGNHTMKHPDLTKIDDKAIFSKQIKGLEKAALEKLGIEISPYFRPPQGRFSEQTLEYLEKLGCRTVFWSFAYADWDNKKQPEPEAAIENIISHTHNGMVILLHPTSKTNAAIMPELLKKWSEMGYRFGTMDELFGISGSDAK